MGQPQPRLAPCRRVEGDHERIPALAAGELVVAFDLQQSEAPVEPAGFIVEVYWRSDGERARGEAWPVSRATPPSRATRPVAPS